LLLRGVLLFRKLPLVLRGLFRLLIGFREDVVKTAVCHSDYLSFLCAGFFLPCE
jgi:hypothetical protein